MSKLIRNLVFLSLLASTVWAQQPALYERLSVYKEAQGLFDKGKYGAAKEKFRAFIQSNPSSSLPHDRNDLVSEAKFNRALCSFHLLNGDAIGLFRHFLAEYPTHPKHDEALFHIGKTHYIRKEYEEAVPFLEELEAGNLNRDQATEARFMLGYGYYKQGKMAQAKEKFGQIRLATGTYGEMGAYYYAVIAYQEGDYASAYEAFTRVKPDAKYAENLDVLKASSLLKLGRYEELDALGKSLTGPEGEKANVETWFILANSAYERQRWEEAIRYFTTFEQRRGRMNREAQYRLGHSYYNTRDYTKARERFEKALTPEDAVAQSAYYYLGHCFLKADNFENARTAFKKAASLTHDPAIASEALYLYAKASFETRYFDEALAAMRDYVEANPSSPYLSEAKGLIGEMLLYANNYKDAIEYLEQPGGLSTPRAQAAYQRACYYYGLTQFDHGKYDVAADYFKKAFNNRQDPGITLPAYYWYAESLYRNGDYKNAIPAYDAYLKQPYAGKHEYYAVGWYGIAWAELKLKDYSSALQNFEKFIGLADREREKELYTDAILRAGDCEFLQKNYSEALKYYKQVRDFNHMHVDYALVQMGKVYFRLSDYQKAAEANVQLATNYRKSEWRDDALLAAADIYLTWLNDWNSAGKYARIIEKDHPDSPLLPSALLRVAVAEVKSGNNAVATTYFKKVAFDHCMDDKARTAALASLADILEPAEYDQVESESRRRCPFKQDGGQNEGAEELALSIADQRYFEDNYTSSVERYTNFLSDFPRSRQLNKAYFYRGQSYEKLKRPDKALADYEVVYKSDQINDFTLKALKSAADIHFARGNNLAAMELYAAMEGRSDRMEDRLSAQFGKASIHMANRDYGAAKKELLAIQADPNTTEYSRTKAKVQIAVCDYFLSNTDAALNSFAEVEKDNKNVFGAESQYYITRILYDKGQFAASRDTAIYLKDKYPGYNNWKAKAFLILAEDYLQLGDTFQATTGTLESLAAQDAYPDIRDAAKQRLEEVNRVYSGRRQEAPQEENEGETDNVDDLIKEEDK